MAVTGTNQVSNSLQNVLEKAKASMGNPSEAFSQFGDVLNQSLADQSKCMDRASDVNQFKRKAVQVSASTKVVSKETTATSDVQKDTIPTKKKVTNNFDLTAFNEMIQQLLGTSNNLRQEIMSEFSVSEKDFEKALESLGISTVDLFQPEILSDFLMEVTGNDVSALLTDESFAQNFQEIMDFMKEINPIDELGLSENEAKQIIDFANQLENADDVMNQEKVNKKDLLDDIDDNEEDITISNSDEINGKVDETKETKSDSNASNGQNEKKESQKEIKVTVTNTTTATTNSSMSIVEHLTTAPAAKEIVEQIVKEIKVKISPDQTSMEMVLTPETLGKVNLTVSAKHGVMTAHLVTQTQAAKEAIESQIATLKETLANQGVKVEAVEVTVASYNFDFMNHSEADHEQEQQHSKVRKSNGKLRMTEDSEDEEQKVIESSKELANASVGKGTQIDLTA